MADLTASLEIRTYERAEALGRQLLAVGWKVVTAESCTGGAIARALTEIGGSSQWFERGFVTYSNESKRDCLGVDARSLDVHGAVSEVVAREMAQGALRHSLAQIAISVTGIAGPGGAVPGKPVGTVSFGWATEQRVETATRLLEGDRTQIRLLTALHALEYAASLLPSRNVTFLA